jgi:cytochrome b561
MQAFMEPEGDVYDKVTIRLHWATALLVAILWLMGRTTGFLPRGPLRIDIWSVHILLGFTLAGILIARLVWRATKGRRLRPEDRGVSYLLAAITHGLLYLLLLAVVTLGVINVRAQAFPLFNVWSFPRLGQDDFRHQVNAFHNIVANIVIAMALLHASAALFHRFVLKDAVLRRMWPTLRS